MIGLWLPLRDRGARLRKRSREAGEGEIFVSATAKIFVSPSAPAGHLPPRGRLQEKTADTYYRCLPFLMQNFL